MAAQRVAWRAGASGALCSLLLVLAPLPARGAAATAPAGAEATAPAAGPAAGRSQIIGRWKGSKLRCLKEEGKLVRCGTPTPFEIEFGAGGRGTTRDENFPEVFAWRWLSETEIGITPVAGGLELKLFGMEFDDASLTFQAYIYPPTSDPNMPPESRYVHFIFDVTLE